MKKVEITKLFDGTGDFLPLSDCDDWQFDKGEATTGREEDYTSFNVKKIKNQQGINQRPENKKEKRNDN